MLTIVLIDSSTLFIETGALNKTQSSPTHVVIFCLCFNKESLPEDQSVELSH